MQLARFYASLLFFMSFSLLSLASPVATGLLVRDGSCDCGSDLVNIFTDLKLKVDADVLLLDGVNTPSHGIDALVAHINAAADLAAHVDLKVAFIDADLSLCVQICVEIILAILAGCLKYSVFILLGLVGKLDLALCALLNACIKLDASFLAKIVLNVQLLAAAPALTIYGFVKIIAVLGLHI
ncbi:hypothetical protein DL93DRAFT_2156118 [Clavulina sp. PMI_390]|nr:hypothetical protein DL93DRAFT_2156118 [Clavulina sp. PMI_390]